jgi:hypothetical protein
MNARSAREYTMFTLAQIFLNWRKQRPSNEGDLDSSVTGQLGRAHYTGVDLFRFNCCTTARYCFWIAY